VGGSGAFIVYRDNNNGRDIAFRIKHGHQTIPDEQTSLKNEIETSLTVIQTVFPDNPKWVSFLRMRDRRKFEEYFHKLLALAQVGLQFGQVPVARQALAALQMEFEYREGAIVKNTYLRRLLFYSSSMVLVVISMYIVVREYAPHDSLVYHFRNFFLLIAGSSIGTWLSFSIRRVQLRFFELAVLEEDRLNPGIRLLFVCGLTFTIGLLFWLEVVVINIGKFDTNFTNSGTKAVLIGLLCGIAEKGLSTAVSRRATELVERIGGAGATMLPAAGAISGGRP
jgi:hypothetical protein